MRCVLVTLTDLQTVGKMIINYCSKIINIYKIIPLSQERLFKREFTSLQKLKSQVLRKLQFYWLPRYFQMKLQDSRFVVMKL